MAASLVGLKEAFKIEILSAYREIIMCKKAKVLSLLINIALFGSGAAFAESITSPLTINNGDIKSLINGDSIVISGNNGVMVDGGEFNLTNTTATISAIKNGGYGLSAIHSGKIFINGGEYNFDSNTVANGIRLQSGGKLDISGSKITSGGNTGIYTINLQDIGSTSLINNSEITSNNGSLLMLGAGGHAVITDSVLTVGGSQASTVYSLSVQGADSELTGERLKVVSNANYEWTSGLFLVNTNKLTLKDSSITSNTGQTMLYVTSSGKLYGDGLTMDYKSQSSDGARGMIALRAASGGSLDLKNSVLNVSGDNASVGMFVYGGSHVTADYLTINAYDKVQAIQIKDSNSTVVLNNSQITTGDTLYGVHFANGAPTSSSNVSSMTLENTKLDAKNWALNAYNGGALVNVSGSDSYIHGGIGTLYVTAKTADADMVFNLSDRALLSGNAFVVDANGFNAKLDLNLSSGSVWNGDVLTYDQNSAVNVNLQSGAGWQGAVSTDSTSPDIGTVNISINAANWDMTADSTVNTLTMADNGSVALGSGSANGYRVLTVGELSGNGVFTLRTDLVGDGTGNSRGDLLRVTGTTDGAHVLNILNNGSVVTNGSETLTVVETADGNGLFRLRNKVELGGYVYDLGQKGNDWQLASSGVIDPQSEPESNSNPGPKPEISEGGKAPVQAINAGYLLNMAETQTLLQRMGELRGGESNGNVWLRGFGGGFDNKMSPRISGFDMTYEGTQLGADKRFNLSGGDFYLGAMTGLSRSEQDYNSGDGTVRSYHFGLYGTYIHQSGFYVDSLVKYSDMKYKFGVNDTAGNRVSADTSSDNYSASVEVGQRFHFNAEKEGFYLEPQLQLTYGYQSSTDFNESNGLLVNVDSYTSTQGRAGLNIGYDIKNSGMPLNIYAKTSYVKEYGGDVDYRLNGSKESQSFKDEWWIAGIGVAAQVAPQHAIYIDMEQANGGQFDQHQINGGYRFSF